MSGGRSRKKMLLSIASLLPSVVLIHVVGCYQRERERERGGGGLSELEIDCLLSSKFLVTAMLQGQSVMSCHNCSLTNKGSPTISKGIN